MDLQQYLNGKNAQEVVVNGEVKGYYISGRNDIFIPTSVINSGNKNVGLLTYMPGTGGSGADAKVLRARILNDPPNYVVSIASEYQDRYNCLERGYEAAQSAGLNVTDHVNVCFSGSGYIGINHVEKFLESHPGIKSTIISCEPSNNTTRYTVNYKDSNVTALKQNNADVIFVTPEKFRINMNDQVRILGNTGVNAYWLQTNYQGDFGSKHQTTNRDIQKSGIIDYIFGQRGDFNKNPGSTYTTNYSFYKFDKASGNIISSDYSSLLHGGATSLSNLTSNLKDTTVGLPNIEDLKKVDSFTITTKDSPVIKKYNVLNNLEHTDISSKSGGTVSSDYVYVSETMKTIKNQIKSSGFMGGGGRGGFKSFGFRASSGIPGCIVGYLNAYFDIVGSLLNSLSLEADAVTSYGQAMVDMDDDLSKEANGIGEVEEIDQSSKLIAIGGLDAYEDKTTGTGQTIDSLTPEGIAASAAIGTAAAAAASALGTTSQARYDTASTGSTSTGSSSYSPSYSSGNSSGGGSPSYASSEPQEEKKEETKPAVKRDIKVNVPKKEEASPVPQPAPQAQTPVVETPPSYGPAPQEGGSPVPPAPEPTTADIPKEGPMDEDMDSEETLPIDTETIEIPHYTKIPTSTAPMDNRTVKRPGSSVLPVVAGLSVAAATGIGVKAYIDKKTNHNNDLEEYEYDYDSENYDSDNIIEEDYEERETEKKEEVLKQPYTTRTIDELSEV